MLFFVDFLFYRLNTSAVVRDQALLLGLKGLAEFCEFLVGVFEGGYGFFMVAILLMQGE